jgi:carbonic anhydrase
MTKQEIIDRLKTGNENFVKNKLVHENQDGERKSSLVGGQKPFAIILSCADSRVVPELAFDAGLGELFVVRVAGNVANTSSIASMEYAVANLGTSVIVVLGHESCGAVTAAVQGGDNGYNLNHLLAHIAPAISRASDSSNVDEVIRVNAKLTVDDLINRSAIIGDAVKSGNVQIIPAYYHLDSGSVEFLNS